MRSPSAWDPARLTSARPCSPRFWTFGQTISLILDTFEFQLDEPWQEVYVDRLGSPEQGAER
jgi:hypothetical protein